MGTRATLPAIRLRDNFTKVKTTAVPLTDAVYDQVERLAAQRHLTVPDLLRQAVEQMVLLPATPATPAVTPSVEWRFPEARHPGDIRTPAEDLRLLANEAGE